MPLNYFNIDRYLRKKIFVIFIIHMSWNMFLSTVQRIMYEFEGSAENMLLEQLVCL